MSSGVELGKPKPDMMTMTKTDLIKPSPEQPPHHQHEDGHHHERRESHHQSRQTIDKSQHPLHQYDLSIMKRFYESCVNKFKETPEAAKWDATEWANINPAPSAAKQQQQQQQLFGTNTIVSGPAETSPIDGYWPNPLVMSQKQRVYEAFAKLAKECGEPMVLMPSFDYGDIANFERFLAALKQDGVNAIGRYKQYLNNKDMRKFEVDLVVVHARYGVLLLEVKDADYFDAKRRSKARAQLSSARGCFESMGRLIAEANGWTLAEGHLLVSEFIALPNVEDKPFLTSSSPAANAANLNMSNVSTTHADHNQSTVSSVGSGPSHRTSTSHYHSHRSPLGYLLKPDLASSVAFASWWTREVVEPKVQRAAQLEADGKPANKFDLKALNCLIGLISCVRNNSIMPVVYPETEMMGAMVNENERKPSERVKEEMKPLMETGTDKETKEKKDDKDKDPKEAKETPKEETEMKFEPALQLRAEFFPREHEAVRAQNKVVVVASDAERLRKAVCMQTLYFLLNDTQKKISVVCSELNKAYYEAFFARQRQVYANLNNVRFYADVHSCAQADRNTLRKDGEIWFFDGAITAAPGGERLGELVERLRELSAFWVFTSQEQAVYGKHKTELDAMGAKIAKLSDEEYASPSEVPRSLSSPWLSSDSLKLPLRMNCDLLVIGDIVSLGQMKPLYECLKNTYVLNQSQAYQSNATAGGASQRQHQHQQQQPQQTQQLKFNPMKKFRNVKYLRGGSIENIRAALKMHDSIVAPVVLVHVGDEDLFKTRNNSATTVERVKELAALVREFCPRSFTLLSTLMRRSSRTENGVIAEVNKGIVHFVKQTKEQHNLFYMLNSHFEPEYHTQEGRSLSPKGLKLYVENFLFMVDYFMIRNNKQQ